VKPQLVDCGTKYAIGVISEALMRFSAEIPREEGELVNKGVGYWVRGDETSTLSEVVPVLCGVGRRVAHVVGELSGVEMMYGPSVRTSEPRGPTSACKLERRYSRSIRPRIQDNARRAGLCLDDVGVGKVLLSLPVFRHTIAAAPQEQC